MVKVDRSIVPTNGMDLLDVHRVDQLDVHQDDPSNLVAFVVHHDRLHVEDRVDVAHVHQTLPDVVVDHRTIGDCFPPICVGIGGIGGDETDIRSSSSGSDFPLHIDDAGDGVRFESTLIEIGDELIISRDDRVGDFDGLNEDLH
ncbi:hypothetical protein RDWZM_001417 [Blomia tropicalis]|uniref:Uncharacterized protein n=1 Tax=Blomia tropicalis TaxID=40697 RepID=A0A9Q0MEJ0_BLOTA|nr:hypothetical protein RDWZM_001417 [Blomia tropicalis]